MLENKPELTAEEIKSMCPSLTANQIWHLCNNFEDEEYPGVGRKTLHQLGVSNKNTELIQDDRKLVALLTLTL